MSRILSLVCAACVAIFPMATHAGSSNASQSVLPAADVAAFSDQVQQDLAARGVQVAIVARMGRDPDTLPDGITYTHLGFWVYSTISTADGSTGTGYRVFNLYQRNGDRTTSDLVQDSPADFFAGAKRLDAGIIIPDPRLQRRLLSVIQSPTYAALHNPRYSVLANPANDQFQNCTEHTLNVLMAALYDTSNKARIKANIAAHFTAQPIEIDGLQRALAPTLSQALTTADHGEQVATATFGSVARFMAQHGLALQTYRITPGGAVRY
ncbi:DUF2145 domain-containing protein [Yoonia sp. R2331]|uniref:DUF2145 domain-containing protein n=1 Tax=Yoonia sp. R2331 TaxID=3237238 RepID=UPI0034E5FE56